MFDGDYEHLMTIDWSDNHICGYPGRISFYQPDVEETMDAVARAHGAEVNQGWEIVDFEQGDDGSRSTRKPAPHGLRRGARRGADRDAPAT